MFWAKSMTVISNGLNIIFASVLKHLSVKINNIVVVVFLKRSNFKISLLWKGKNIFLYFIEKYGVVFCVQYTWTRFNIWVRSNTDPRSADPFWLLLTPDRATVQSTGEIRKVINKLTNISKISKIIEAWEAMNYWFHHKRPFRINMWAVPM